MSDTFSNDFTQLLGKYIQLHEGRKVWKGNRPFHKDTSAFFMVYPSKEIFKCFGCGLDGGKAEFTRAIEARHLKQA